MPIHDRTSFESLYTGQPRWEIGRPQKALLDVADQISEASSSLFPSRFLMNRHQYANLLGRQHSNPFVILDSSATLADQELPPGLFEHGIKF